MTSSRPPMGWNSWDCFGGSVTEAEVLANARFMAEHLLPHGWDTVVVDIQWYEPEPGAHDYNAVATPCLDGYGRPQPAPNRFPSAADGRGFTALAAQVHALGLRFGVHVMRGIPRAAVDADLPILGTSHTAREIADPVRDCAWNPDNHAARHDHPASQAWYDSCVAQLASWGVDFVKLDDVLYPYAADDIAAYATAIRRSGREIRLSLSPGRELSLAHREHLQANATMWRISDDLWDAWPTVVEQFQRLARWAAAGIEKGFPDADMLPLGRLGIRAHVGTERDSELTLAEQGSLLALWCIARSPLMMGGHLPATRPETIALLTDDAILGLLDTTGGREVVRDNGLVFWTATRADGSLAVVAFWHGDQPREQATILADLGLPDDAQLRDVRTGEVVGRDGVLRVTIPAHGVRILTS